MALIIFLLLVCWLWWDQMHQIKRVATECLTDAINAKLIADQQALEAIHRYNQHIEMCNRVIENQESGLAQRVRGLATRDARFVDATGNGAGEIGEAEGGPEEPRGHPEEAEGRHERGTCDASPAAEAELSTRRAQRS